MKEELLQLYRREQPVFRNIISSFPNDDLAGPFLMSPTSRYKTQKLPLLIVGQETNGWTHYIDELEKQMNTYEKFDVGSSQPMNAFWNIIRKVEAILGNEPCSCAWTNMSRFDLYGGKVYGKYEKEIAKLDKLISDEIRILAPKICLFFTGPDFDRRLKRVYDGLEFIEIPGWEPNQLSLVKHNDLPVYTFRSYHPKSLKLRRLEGQFIQTLADFMRVGSQVN